MAISFVGAGALAASTTTPLTPTLPAHSAGDFILLVVANRQGAITPTVPSGYVVLGRTRQRPAATADAEMWVFGKIAGASESDPTVSTASSVTSGWGVQTAVWSGVAAEMLDTGLRWTDANLGTGNQAIPNTRTASDNAEAVAIGFSTDDNTLALLSGSEQGFTLIASNNGTSTFSLLLARRSVASRGDVTGPTLQQTVNGPDTWGGLGVLSLLAADETPVGPRLMAHTYSAWSAATTELSLSFAFPPAAGDLILVGIVTSSSGEPAITFTGYTQEAKANRSTNRWAYLYHKWSAGNETQVAWTNNQGNWGQVGSVQIWRDVDPTTPFDVANTENDANGTTIAGPAITPVTDDAAVVSMAGCYGVTSFVRFSASAGFRPSWLCREYLAELAGSGDPAIYGSDLRVPTAQATTAPTYEASAARDWVGITTALRPAPVALPPDAPANPAAVALSASSIRVTWDDVADETGFRVERSADGTTGWTDVSGNLAAGTVLFDDTGLTASTQYFYRVIAFNAVGDSSPSSTVNATTDAGPPPPSPGGNRMGGFGAIRKPPRRAGR